MDRKKPAEGRKQPGSGVRAAFCGSFDPVTLGHMDLIERAAAIYDELWIFVTPNSAKKDSWSASQRMQWIEEACHLLDNVHVALAKGLAVDCALDHGCSILLRGIRNGADFEYEANMACMNHLLNGRIETMAMFCSPAYMYVSSSNVRELLKYHQSIERLVPENVFRDLQPELYERSRKEAA